MSQTKTAEFGKWRSIFWPIHNFELKKIAADASLILFNFIQLYSVKRH